MPTSPIVFSIEKNALVTGIDRTGHVITQILSQKGATARVIDGDERSGIATVAA
jgi:UDP-N-acetylmuramoylalanine-D-glutamate ligase